jgi:carboxyl-terminal processing protease
MSDKNANTALWMGVAVAIGILIGSLLDYQENGFNLLPVDKQENKIKRLINYIQYDYVDEIDTDSLLDGAINHLLQNLDPHSTYIPKKELQRIQESMDGNFKGIGIQFRLIRDSVVVLNVIKGGPGEKAGLLAGDRILIADKDTLYGKLLNSNQVMAELKGREEDEVHLTIYRKQFDSILNYTFNRGDVNITSVPVYYMINNTVGFIKIERFARNTFKEFKTALDNLQQQGMQTLVLDLRANTGGFLDVANAIADEFLSDGELIVFTKNKEAKITNSFATEKGGFEKGKLYVLIDEESASASEIVAGALQDNDRGIIVGRRSFGKGLVQQEMDLGDGSAVRLTTARYYTPTGRSIQKPYDHNGNADYYRDRFHRMESGELLHKDSIPVNDSLKYTTPKGKVVYGGGGIVPDIFVPIDTTLYYPAYHLANINNFVFDYIDKDRAMYSKMTWEVFDTDFDVSKMLKEYLKTGSSSVTYYKTSLLKTYLKALTARELFGETGFYKIYETRDNMIQKVLELENNPEKIE